MMKYALALAVAFAALPVFAADNTTKDADIKTLAELQSYVGGWRGVGQPERGSTRGAWSEKAEWAWKFRDGHAALAFTVADGKHIASGEISPAKTAGQFELTTLAPDTKQPTKFIGGKNDSDQFIFERVDNGANNEADAIGRITLRQVAEGKRLLVLLERRAGGSNQYTRLAEIGYTRQGVQFAAGGGEPECVVTGGRGTITVSYQGQTYYVCCTGCKDLFDADPAGVLAEYKAKRAKKAAEGK